MTTAFLLVLLGALARLLPHPQNFVPLGGIALYAGARLPRRLSIVVPLAALALSDLLLDFGTGRPALTLVRATVYGSFAAIALLGRLASRPTPPVRLALLSVTGSVFFYATTNFANWREMGTYPLTAAGLAVCYVAAIPWFWASLSADLLGTAVLFGVDALARRRAVARAGAAAVAAVLLLRADAGVAQTAPFSENVVVSATAAPEERDEVGSAATVITREEIERNGWRTVSDALRSAPGISVTQSGGPGAQTSVFLRGANSTHTLVLVDGVRVNSPFFSGYDFALLSTENVERIEIVRGPFSALYGSDSIGGVVQVFARPAGVKPSGRVSAEAGNGDGRAAEAFVTGGSGAFGAAASYRDVQGDGDRQNDDWRERSGSARLEGRFGESVRVALEAAAAAGDLGLPGAAGAEALHDRYRAREERVSLPVTFRPADGHAASVVLGWVASRPTFETVGFREDTDARTFQARVSDSMTLGAHGLTAFAGWERWSVDDSSNFGPNLDGSRATLWNAGLEDSARFGALTVTGGVRYDHHSQFGQAWSPRAAVAWRAGPWKVRASAGTAFRAPSVGELYFPFSGNPDLSPERSASYDVGVDRQVRAGRVEVSLFWNEYRDLIVYDFSRSLNFNVGRARTRGVEAAWRQDLSPNLAADLSYTYLESRDRDTGLALIRRPRHSGSAGLTARVGASLEISPRALFVGPRADFDALTRDRIEDPGYVRIDLLARYRLGVLSPFARVQNLAGRSYAEVDGFPVPGRRWAAGLEARF